MSDKLSSSELCRAQKELTSKEKVTALLRAATHINYDKLCVSGINVEKLLRETFDYRAEERWKATRASEDLTVSAFENLPSISRSLIKWRF